ncbi:uncharacterized protein [Primulina huaijiensis]|uniref:uncharacterized protein n=1 Tax=Primulina huaijiensis TaxID=1492673 RepID=UPI003CC774BB
MWRTFNCFICKEKGHKDADCPRNKGPATGKSYVMHAEEAKAEPDTTLLLNFLNLVGSNGFDGIFVERMIFISSVAIYALLDSGATNSFISETFVKRLGIIISEDMDLGFRVSIPSGDQMFTSKIVKSLELRLQKNVVHAYLIVLTMHEFDIILDMDWLSSNGASIDFRQRSVSVRPPNGKSFVLRRRGTSRCRILFPPFVRGNL